VKKRLIIYGIFIAALMLFGALASLITFGEEAAEVLPPVPSQLKLFSGLNEEMALSHKPREPVLPASSEANELIKVVEVKGTVTHFREERDKWEEINVGESLENKDRIRTSRNAKLTLGVGEKSRIELMQSAELTVVGTDEKEHHLKLVRGKLSVDYRERKRKIRIESSDGTAAVEATQSSFSMLDTGTTVAVATKTGKVDLFTADKQVEVTAGEQSVVVNGLASRPEPIPADVVFRLVDPGCQVQREDFIVLKGRTSKGASVFANGNPATIDSEGNFSVRVPLRNGKNKVLVVTEDAFGHHKKRMLSCITVNPRAAIKGIDIEWGPS
jgi:hypothetical protein